MSAVVKTSFSAPEILSCKNLNWGGQVRRIEYLIDYSLCSLVVLFHSQGNDFYGKSSYFQ